MPTNKYRKTDIVTNIIVKTNMHKNQINAKAIECKLEDMYTVLYYLPVDKLLI